MKRANRNHREVRIVVLVAFVALGCGSPPTSDGSAAPSQSAGGAFGGVGTALEDQQRAAAQRAAEEAAAQAAAEEARKAREAEPRKVSLDDMKRGRSLRGGGYLATVFSARFRAEHKLILIQVQQAMQLYNATNGHYPRSHEEFMEQIIAANSLRLPELDEGFEYLYDPSDHELKMRQVDANAEETGGPEPTSPPQ